MSTRRCRDWFPAGWWVHALAFGWLIVLATAAHAQAARPYGAVLTVYQNVYADIRALNAQANPPAVLHYNNDVYTLSFVQSNQILVPKMFLDSVQRVNFEDPLDNYQATANPDVVSLTVPVVSRSFVPETTRFLLVRKQDAGAIASQNQGRGIYTVHTARMSILGTGGRPYEAALLAVDQASAANIKFPTSVSMQALTDLNTNVAVRPLPGGGGTVTVNPQANAPGSSFQSNTGGPTIGSYAATDSARNRIGSAPPG